MKKKCVCISTYIYRYICRLYIYTIYRYIHVYLYIQREIYVYFYKILRAEETVPWICCKGSAKLPLHKKVVPAVLIEPFPQQSSSNVALEEYATEIEPYRSPQGPLTLVGIKISWRAY